MAYYRDKLGFTVNYEMPSFAVIDRDKARILLVTKSEQHPGPDSCYIYVRDADALHAELLAKGARIQGLPVSHPWGLRDFVVLDLGGNELTLGQPFE